MISRFEFLERIYLPGYMGLKSEDYQGRKGTFDFNPTEPPVARIVNYLTPRGAHVFISQAGLCVVEQVIESEGIGMSVDDFRELTVESRMKIVELNQKYRREVRLDRELQGQMELTTIRWGRLPIIRMEFDISNGAIHGDLIGVLASKPVAQMNGDLLRG